MNNNLTSINTQISSTSSTSSTSPIRTDGVSIWGQKTNNQRAQIIFGDDSIQIGELKMKYDEFELCLTHLLELTKRENPEEFI